MGLNNLMTGVTHFSMGLMFLLSAYVNLNDPDPEIWITIYLLGAALAFNASLYSLNLMKWHVSYVFPMLFGLSTFLMMAKIHYTTGSTSSVTRLDQLWEFFETEEGREIGGLAILTLGLILITATFWPQHVTKSKQGTKQQPTSVFSSLIYLVSFGVVLLALYAAFWLQPLMNARHPVEHCSGSFEFQPQKK